MIDIVSYILGLIAGKKKGEENVVISGSLTVTDPNSDGNIVISEG